MTATTIAPAAATASQVENLDRARAFVAARESGEPWAVLVAMRRRRSALVEVLPLHDAEGVCDGDPHSAIVFASDGATTPAFDGVATRHEADLLVRLAEADFLPCGACGEVGCPDPHCGWEWDG